MKMKLIKKFYAISLSIALILPCVNVFADNDEIAVFLNNTQIEFDVKPMVQNNRILVPLRAIFEALGSIVDYSAENDGIYIFANKASDGISLKIGEKKLDKNGEEIELDVAPIIVENRTLVPLRAVSEAFGCKVNWDGENNIITINDSIGDISVIHQRIEKTNFADDNETPVMTLIFDYPYIDEDGEFFEKLNEALYNEMEEKITYYEEEFLEDAKVLQKEQEGFTPYVVNLTYNVTKNSEGLLSYMLYEYSYFGGVHPNTVLTSKTIDVNSQTEISLPEALGLTEEETAQYVFDNYSTVLEEYELTDWLNALEERKNDSSFYVKDNKVIVYFNAYDIAPYAYGMPSVESDLDYKSKTDKRLTLSFDANITTGYEWLVSCNDEDAVEIHGTYYTKPQPEGMPKLVGVGGTQKFEITGKKPGKYELTFTYSRPWESVQPIETQIYTVKVAEDLSVSLIETK